MSKRRRFPRPDATGRSHREGKHIRDYEFMLASPAYRSLSCAARCILTELKRLFNGANNGDLFLSVRSAADLVHVHKDTASKALRELQERGFIRPRVKSGFTWKRGQATTWILEEYDFAGQLPTKSFMRWRPGEIQNAVLNGGTECPNPRDTCPSEPDTSGPDCPKRRDTLTPKQGGHGPNPRDTVSLPSGGATKRKPARAAKPPATSGAARAGAAGPSQSDASSTPAPSAAVGAKRPPDPAEPEWRQRARAHMASSNPDRQQLGAAMLAAAAHPRKLQQLLNDELRLVGTAAVAALNGQESTR